MAKKAKMFSGAIGLVVSATNEEEQEDLFFPCDPRLVAVNVNGDPELGSTVWDLNSKNELDEKRGAYLQSAFRVIKEPLGVANALGFQLGPSGMSDSGGGWFVDIPDGGDAASNEIAVGQGSYGALGPLHVGHIEDRHKRGVDADGNPINPLHLSARALFYMDRERDGPLHISEWKRGQDTGIEHMVHFGWNGELKEWDWFVKLPITLTPLETEFKLRDFPKPDPATITPLQPGTPTPGHGPVNRPTSIATVGLAHLAAYNEMSMPAMLAKASPVRSGKMRLNNVIASGGLSSAAVEQFNETPITGQMAAFGAEGGDRTGAYDDQGRDASGDPHAYTQRPGVGKYPEGTAPGGWVLLPPEISLNDIGSGFSPPGITQSTVYFLVGPNVYFGAGIPEISDGTIQDGFSWGWESATADLVFRRHQDGGTPSEVARFVNATGAFQIGGTLDHDGTEIGFFGVTPTTRAAAYTVSNLTSDRSYDADATSVAELADVLGTLIVDLQAYGLLQ